MSLKFQKNENPIPHGFRQSPKPNQLQRPISEMTIRELEDRRIFNGKILATPGSSTSTYGQRLQAEQDAVESRLIEVHGIETISTGLRKTMLDNESSSRLNQFPMHRMIEAKEKALVHYGISDKGGRVGSLSPQEAMDLELQACMRDKLRQNRIDEKKQRLRFFNTSLSRAEREAQIWDFMNYKPSDSDLEDVSEDESDDDPSNWFEDDQDDGRKGQDIVEPDVEDLSGIIRIDEQRLQYNGYETHSGGA